MEIVINGKKIENICTLHMTCLKNQEEGDHSANFVIYFELNKSTGEYERKVLYFQEWEAESIKLI